MLDESVIRRVVGSPQTRKDQLGRLLEADKSPHITLQVPPFSQGAHATALGSFVTIGGTEPALDVAYVDFHTGSLFLEKDEQLDRYWLAFEYLRTQALDMDSGRVGTCVVQVVVQRRQCDRVHRGSRHPGRGTRKRLQAGKQPCHSSPSRSLALPDRRVEASRPERALMASRRCALRRAAPTAPDERRPPHPAAAPRPDRSAREHPQPGTPP